MGELNQPHVVLIRGTGSIGSRHLKVLRDRLGLKPIAFPARSQSCESQTLEGFELATNLHEAKNTGADAAIVATSTGRHITDAAQLMDIGCHVLIEKPLSVDALGLNSLYEQSIRLQRLLFVACCLRFDKGLLLFKELLPQIGTVHNVRIECQSYLPDWRPGRDYRTGYAANKEEGGVLRDLIHEIDYATWIFGRPQHIFASLQNHGILGIESEESADLLWHTPGRASVSLHLDYITRRTRRVMHAFGEHGEIEWLAHEQKVILRIGTSDEKIIEVKQDRDDLYSEQFASFLQAINGQDPGNLATFDDGAFAVLLCDAARRSSQTGQMEKIGSLNTRATTTGRANST